MCRNLLIIGISGVTCGGKTTVATELNKILPDSKVFSQDDYFLNVTDERHTWITELNHINFELLTSLDMEKMHQDILDYIKNNNFRPLDLRINQIDKYARNGIIDDYRKLAYLKVRQSETHILIIEGFSIYNYKPMSDLFNLKYYFTLDKEECKRRRINRVYEPPDCPGYFEKIVWPAHLVQFQEVKAEVSGVTYFSEQSKNPIDDILKDIISCL